MTRPQARAAGAAGRTYWAPRAWVDGAWADKVLLACDAQGTWTDVRAGVTAPAGAEVLAGPVLPGLVDAHSHAFQRTFAGQAERRALDQDDFWSWRDGMYRAALQISPAQQRAIAAQLFLELARGGFTHVCEFHYLHNDPAGQPYEGDPACMARAVVDGAREVGLGVTLLPTVYERAGFGQEGLREDQRRFRADADTVLALREALRKDPDAAKWPAALRPHLGLALHSLRAASPQAIERLVEASGAGGSDTAPIHIHIAEQMREVDDCLDATGLRPIAWLCHHVPLDRRWHLVHATHASPAEIEMLGRTGAGVVLCPSTEANLGDGLCDLPRWLRSGVPLSLGTDSHVTRAAFEELRLLEYGQRLVRRERCIGAAPQLGEPSTAARLWNRILDASAAAAGFAAWGLQAGARADLLVIDTKSPALLGVAEDYLLDTLAFSSPSRPFRDVLVAGRWVTRNHQHPHAAFIAERFVQAMGELRQA